jgi:hypothetical protein
MNISEKKTFWTLMIITICLIGIHSCIVISPLFLAREIPLFIVDRFNLNAEANLPTWYSTILLFLVSLVSYLIYRLGLRIPKEKWFPKNLWLLMSLVYLFLSIDEAAQLHEIMDQLIHLKWIYVYAPLAGLVFMGCFYYFIILRRKDGKLGGLVIGGMVVFAIGGLVSEWISYKFNPLRYAYQQIEFVVEEGLELIGVSMVLTGCLQELNARIKRVFLAEGKD